MRARKALSLVFFSLVTRLYSASAAAYLAACRPRSSRQYSSTSSSTLAARIVLSRAGSMEFKGVQGLTGALRLPFAPYPSAPLRVPPHPPHTPPRPSAPLRPRSDHTKTNKQATRHTLNSMGPAGDKLRRSARVLEIVLQNVENERIRLDAAVSCTDSIWTRLWLTKYALPPLHRDTCKIRRAELDTHRLLEAALLARSCFVRGVEYIRWLLDLVDERVRIEDTRSSPPSSSLSSLSSPSHPASVLR